VIIQLALFFYVLIGLTHLINEYMMRNHLSSSLACLENLSHEFNLSQSSTGILVAVGISIPELTTNILSVFGDNQEMIGYGFGAIVGSGVFGIDTLTIDPRLYPLLRHYCALLQLLP
jgi:Ca2+/Na+ antiporter